MSYINYLSWLKNQKEYPKFYWKNKYSQEKSASAGIKKTLKTLSLNKQSANCVFDFALNDMHIWIPKYEINSEKPWTPVEDTLERDKKYEIVHSFFLPDFPMWETLVTKAKTVKKVVLARSTFVKLNKTVCPFSLMQKLEEKAGSAHLFLYQPEENVTFFGASPETLFIREDNRIFSEAIAGTRKLGKTEAESRQIFKEFIHSEKDLEEFSYVENFLNKNFSKICKSHTKSELNVLKTSWVQHFQVTFQGALKKRLNDWDLLQYFHPTPAVGGTPVDEALSFLEKNEPFARGYYAAPIGRSKKSKSEFAVGIRSCLIKGDTLQVFAGTGLVRDSVAKNEWEELDSKTKWIYEILNG